LIVDDDPEFRDSVVRLLRTVGLTPSNFRLFRIFSRPIRGRPDLSGAGREMPGRSGLELQRELAAANRQLPIIFITAHGDIPMTSSDEGRCHRVPHETVP
jgi:FixJ family two-component response regulator